MREIAALAPAAGVSRGSWTSIGPGNIGGRVRSIVIHPTTTTTMFAGSVSGGILEPTSSGTSWARALSVFAANACGSSPATTSVTVTAP